MKKQFTIAITALCLATAMLAVYCTDVKFENPADPKNGGWNGYACLQGDNTCQEFKSLAEWDACYPVSNRIHKSQCPKVEPPPPEDSVYCRTESGCGKLPNSAACLEAGGTAVEKCSTAAVTPDTTRYTVTFNTNGGFPETIDSVVVDSGGTMGTKFPANPTKDENMFGGWFDKDSIRYHATTNIFNDVELFAMWKDTAGGVTPCNTGKDCDDDPVLCAINNKCSEYTRVECDDVGAVIVEVCPPDPTRDNDDIAVAKKAVEDAVYGPVSQEVLNDEEAAKEKVESIIDGLNLKGDLKGVETEVVKREFTEAVAGAPGSVSGTNGSYTFTVKLNKGIGDGAVTDARTLVITAKPYDPKQDNDDIAAAKKTVEETLYGSVDQADINEVGSARLYVQNIIDSLDLNGVTAVVENAGFNPAREGTPSSPDGNEGSYKFKVKLTKGAGEQWSIELTLKINATKHAFAVTVLSKEHFSGRILNTGAAGGGSYHAGTPVSINAGMSSDGQKFVKWTSVGVTLTNPDSVKTTFIMPANTVEVTAYFSKVCGLDFYDDSTHFCDGRDHKSYRHVTIGTQTWMAENLNYDAQSSVCYDTSPSNCDTYGRLYSWTTAMAGASSSSDNPSKVQGVCPDGWHIPSDAEWTQLTGLVGSDAGTKLKDANGWPPLTGVSAGTDQFGFSALPGGIASGSSFNGFSTNGYWWSATMFGDTKAWFWGMSYNNNNMSYNVYELTDGLSLRCVKNN